jgi:hypothetical protein
MNAEQLNFPEPNVAVVAPTSSSSASEEGASNGAPGGAAGKSRRRRRKRKNRPAANGEAGAAPQAAAGAEGGEAAVAAAAPAQSTNQQQPRQNNGQQQGQGQGQGKRWKKKKHGGRGDGQPRPEPGNSLQGSNSGMGNRGRNRKQQQRGPRSFVGPMDHSYREVNGNYADTPASTIEIHGNHRSRQNNHRNHHFNEDRLPPELMHNQRAVAIPEDAPTHIYFFIEDLFFTAKIQETARLQGVKVAFMKPEKDIVAHLADLPEHDHPSLIVFDLNNANAKPLTLIPKLKSKLKKGTSIIGFLSHLQGDLKAKAVEAGCNSVMPRAAFSQNLPNLLRRYGVEDEHEPNFNM